MRVILLMEVCVIFVNPSEVGLGTWAEKSIINYKVAKNCDI